MMLSGDGLVVTTVTEVLTPVWQRKEKKKEEAISSSDLWSCSEVHPAQEDESGG